MKEKLPPPTGPVTIVFLGQVFRGIWTAGTVREHKTDVLIQANVRRSNEYTTWIRGHYEPNSPEVLALLAAYALSLDT